MNPQRHPPEPAAHPEQRDRALAHGAPSRATSTVASAPAIEKRIIVLEHGDGPISRAGDVLERDCFEVYHPPRSYTAIALCKRKRFDLVLITYPLADMHLADFLSELRTGLSPSSLPDVVVFAEPGMLVGFVAPKLRVLPVPGTYAETEEIILTEVQQPRRAAVRLIARLDARLGNERLLRLCQTTDLSLQGVFVACEELAPIGADMRLELTLDPDEPPIQVEVRVMRHGHPGEAATGMGLRFLRFSRGDRERLVHYLAQPKLWL